MDTLLVIALTSLAAWCVLLFGRNGFWRADQRPGTPSPLPHWPTVAIIIPARNEKDSIGDVVHAHLKTHYCGARRLYVVDDGSEDDTAAIARRAMAQADFPATVLDAPPLEAGWSGKLAAIAAGIAQAESDETPDYFLLTDADILHSPGTLSTLVSQAVTGQLSLVSLMAQLDARGFWGELLIPAFVYFFQKLYPFPGVNNPKSPIAAAAGGCMLVEAKALKEAGGIGEIRSALIDDCALAALLKTRRRRRRIWLGLAQTQVVSLRDNRSLSSIWDMVARTAYAELEFSPVKLIGAVTGMLLVYITPVATALIGLMEGHGLLTIISLATLGGMFISYGPTLRLYEQSTKRAIALPLVAIFYTLMTLSSAWRHWHGKGGQWKGRTYPGGIY